MKTKLLSMSDVLIIIKQLRIGAAVVQAKPSEYQLSECAKLIAQEILDWGRRWKANRTEHKLQSN